MSTLVHFNRGLKNWFENPFANEIQDRFFNSNKEYSIYKNEEGIWTVEVPFPGLTEKEIQVQVDLQNRELILSGHKNEEKEGSKKGFVYTKRADFNRRFSFYIDEMFDLKTIKATCEHGILKIELKESKASEETSKFLEIPVQRTPS